MVGTQHLLRLRAHQRKTALFQYPAGGQYLPFRQHVRRLDDNLYGIRDKCKVFLLFELLDDSHRRRAGIQDNLFPVPYHSAYDLRNLLLFSYVPFLADIKWELQVRIFVEDGSAVTLCSKSIVFELFQISSYSLF